MSRSIFVLSLLALVLGLALSVPVDLTTENFEAYRANSTFLLVQFSAPWCNFCRRLEPIWTDLSDRLAGEITVGRITATKNEELVRRFKVRGFPHILLFGEGSNGWTIEYSGGRSADALESWARAKIQPTVSYLESPGQFGDFLQHDGPLAIGVFEFRVGEAFRNFIQISREMTGVRFGVVGATIASQLHVKQVPAVYVRAGKSEDFHVLASSPLIDRWLWWKPTFALETLSNFIIDVAFPLVESFTPDSFGRAMTRGNPTVFLIQPGNEQQVDKSIDAIINKLAAEFHGRISFLRGDPTALRLSLFGASGQHLPTLVAMPSPKRASKLPERFAWNEQEPITEAAVRKWLQDIDKEQVEVHRKSQPAPESNDGPVYQLVASTYDSVVKSQRNVLVEYYASWCGHCKKLEPIYEQLGRYFAGSPDVLIARIEATENSIDMEISSFPTIVLHTKDGTQVLFEESKRDYETLVDFVQRHTAARPVVAEQAAKTES